MKKRLLCLLLPAAFAVSPTHAAVFSSFGGEHDAVESGSEILFGPESFAGVFDFTLGTESLVTFTGASTLPMLGFGLFDASDSLVSGTIFSPTTYETSFTSVTLDAGDYYYAPVFPTGGSMFSSYSFESYVTAVPEPQTYALFLPGIGMLGYAAQRRMRGDA